MTSEQCTEATCAACGGRIIVGGHEMVIRLGDGRMLCEQCLVAGLGARQ